MQLMGFLCQFKSLCHTQSSLTKKGEIYAVIRKSFFNRDAVNARPFF
jgi:hypothetical protein